MLRSNYQHLDGDVVAAIAGAVNAGHPLKTIMWVYGVNARTVRRSARRHGVKPRLRRIHHGREAAICAALRAGVLGKEIAATFGINVGSINRIQRRNGIPTRPMGGHR